MAFFDDLMTSLKQKWLQFFQENRSWITRQMEMESVNTPDGGRRPPSYLILGVANALEPQLRGLMLPFSKLNPDVDALIDALELNFDPDLMLGNRSNLAANPELPRNEASAQMLDEEVASMLQEPTYNVTVIETVTEVEPDELSVISLDDLDDEVVLVEADDESMVMMSVSELDELNKMLLDDTDSEVVLGESNQESFETPSAAELDTFGDMSLDQIADVTAPLEMPSAAHPNEADDVLSNLWGEETLADSEQADDETRSKNDKQSEHDQEIARLFPNF